MKLLVLSGLLGVSVIAAGQDAKGDVSAHVAAARAAAGDEWPRLVAALCPPLPRLIPTVGVQPRSKWYREPVKIADNLYLFATASTANSIGGVAAYGLTTSDGIILLDANYSYAVKDILDTGMRALGLNPASVKHIVITHGHGDHFGGAKYFQETYGSRIHSADWELMTPAHASDLGALGLPFPRKDLDVADGQTLTLGDTTVSMYHTPGHTPGTLSLLFPVRIHGTSHTAALWGGSALGSGAAASRTTPGGINLENYVASAKRFEERAAQIHADIMLSNHDVYGDYLKKADMLKTKPDGPNPFVVGADGVGRWLQVLQHCAQANEAADAARR
jgi:metallo-beta-lactamase class B